MSADTTPNDTNINEDLTEAQLFSRISKSIKDNDFEQLDALVTVDAPIEETIIEETVVEEVEEPVVETASDEKVLETKEEIPAAPVAQPSDWTANLPKEAQEELQRLRSVEQKFRSESGRVPFLQKKLNELEKKLQQDNKAAPAAIAGGISNKELQEALAQIEEVDPVTAKAFKLLRQEAIGSAQKTQTILEQRDEEALLEREFDKLTKQIPQAPQVFQLPEWQEWKESQTPGVFELANSSYADDVVLAIEKFAKDMQVRYPGIQQTQTVPEVKAEKVEPAPAVVDTKQAAVVEQRARRLAATTPASAAPAPKASTEPSDPEALFSHFHAQITKNDHLDKRR